VFNKDVKVLLQEAELVGTSSSNRHVRNSFLVDKLMSIGFAMLLIDDCIFFCGDIIFMLYMDNGIFRGSNDLQLQDVIKEIQNLSLNIEDQGHPADYVGININKLKDGSYEFTQ
jgi:hypothetical protein